MSLLSEAEKKVLDELNRVTKEVIFPRVLENSFLGSKGILTPQKKFRLPISYRKTPSDRMFLSGANESATAITNVAPPEPSLPPVQPLKVSRRITFEDET